MIYGETGRYPLEINAKIRMLNFWSRLLINDDKLSGKLYKLMIKLHKENMYPFKWASFIQSIFDNLGLSYIFERQHAISKADVKHFAKQIM